MSTPRLPFIEDPDSVSDASSIPAKPAIAARRVSPPVAGGPMAAPRPSDPPAARVAVARPANDVGPDDETDSAAGDVALPLDAEQPAIPQPEAAPPTPDRARLIARLRDPGLRRKLFNYLVRRRQVAEDIADDVVQATYVRAMRATTWPNESRPLYPWMRRYANYTLLGYQSAANTRAEREEGVEDIDAHAVEPPAADERTEDVMRIAQTLASESAHNAKTLEMWARARRKPGDQRNRCRSARQS